MIFAFFTATQLKQKSSFYVYATSAKRRVAYFHIFFSNIRIFLFISQVPVSGFFSLPLIICIQHTKHKLLIFKTLPRMTPLLIADFHTYG